MCSPALPARRRRPRAAGALVLAAVAAAFAAACSRGGQASSEGGGPPPVTVELHRVEAGTLRDVAVFSGQLNAEHSVVLKSETDGVVASVHFDEGQEVAAGDVLFRLRSEEQVARVREAEAQRALTQEVYNRTRNLVSRNAASIAQNDEAAAHLAVARARVELAKVSLQRTEIRAPFGGVVGMRRVSPGARVTDETPLLQLDAVDRLELVFSMTDAGIVLARPGLEVDVHVAPYPDETFPGVVFFVSPTVDPVTRRLLLKAWVPNDQRRLRPGLFANVDLEVGERQNAIVVPESAVAVDRNGSYVWRVGEDDAAQRAPVKTGLRKGGGVEITQGLAAGDRIVAAGIHKVREGKRLVAAAPVSSGTARSQPAGASGGEGT